MQIDDGVRARFWAKVDKRGPDDCWNWTAATNQNGPKCGAYGVMGIGGKRYTATHVALAVDGRPRPDGLHALHSCHNSLCVNPKHLRWGTKLENAFDSFERGTTQRLFTDDEVRMVRADQRPHAEIAAEYGCSQTCISTMKRGKTYGWLPAA